MSNFHCPKCGLIVTDTPGGNPTGCIHYKGTKSLLVEIDKEQAEWVVVAYLAQDPRMLQVIEEQLDSHITTGKLISQAPEESIKKEAKLLGHETDQQKILDIRKEHLPELLTASGFVPRNMTIRQMGKKSNHALNYDMSYKRFSLENETPEREAKLITSGYYNIYPGIKQTFHADVQRQLGVDRTIENFFGRKRRFLGPWNTDLFKEAYSFLPQSTVVDIVNRALVRVYKLEIPRGTVDLRIHNHDSLVFIAYYDDYQQLYETILRVVEYLSPEITYHGQTFKIRNEVKAGYNWSDMVELPHLDEQAFIQSVQKLEAENLVDAKE